MSKKNKDFYVHVMEECGATYELWGTDMMSMYDDIEKDFPNAIKAIHKMYDKLRKPNFYKASFLVFEKVEYVYEALANLIPHHEELFFDIITREQDEEYKNLNICSEGWFAEISRIDLIMAVLLFTEEFILKPVKSKMVNVSDDKLTVDGTFVKLEVSKGNNKTYVSILIKDVILFKYVILN